MSCCPGRQGAVHEPGGLNSVKPLASFDNSHHFCRKKTTDYRPVRQVQRQQEGNYSEISSVKFVSLCIALCSQQCTVNSD